MWSQVDLQIHITRREFLGWPSDPPCKVTPRGSADIQQKWFAARVHKRICDSICDSICVSICDSNFGPDQLYNRIHLNIINSLEL